MAEDDEFGEGPKAAGKEGPKAAGKEGPKGAGKGNGDDRGSANQVAENVFRQVSRLGGFLVVAVVAPLAPASGASGNGSGPRDFALAALQTKAVERLREAAAAERSADERDRKRRSASEKAARLSTPTTEEPARKARVWDGKKV